MEEKVPLAKGDKVKFGDKSPTMTIEKIEAVDGIMKATCAWWNTNANWVSREVFDVETLTKVAFKP